MNTWNYLQMRLTSDDLTPWERPIFYIHNDPVYDDDGYEYVELPEDDYNYTLDDFNYDCYREGMYFGHSYGRD
jgi:hypothetical protein